MRVLKLMMAALDKMGHWRTLSEVTSSKSSLSSSLVGMRTYCGIQMKTLINWDLLNSSL